MRRTLAASALALLFISGGSATAARAPHCKVLSSHAVEQTRDISGVIVGVHYVDGKPVYEYGHGVQHRTQTTTSQRCRGKVSTSVTYTPWTY